jgi:hypothetical protein
MEKNAPFHVHRKKSIKLSNRKKEQEFPEACHRGDRVPKE